MKTEKWFNEKLKEFKDDIEFRLEGVILELTEKICKRMEEKNINRSELASLLQVSPAFVTKILNGTSNFTLKTMMLLADALECQLSIDLKPKEHARFVMRYEPITVDRSYWTEAATRPRRQGLTACSSISQIGAVAAY